MERILPELHRYAKCPDFGTKILNFYDGYYEAVFIFLHPFLKPNSTSYDKFNPSTWPTKNEIVKHTRKISWKDFLKMSSIENIEELDLGLRGIIGGIKEIYTEKNTEKKIIKHCEKNKIVQPQEGFIPEIIFNDLMIAIQNLSYNWIWACDEFSLERKLIFIDDVIKENFIIPHGNYFTYNHELLVTTNWDSHFSLICGNIKDVQAIVNKVELEGFYCSENTMIEWSYNSKFKNI